ncbi:MAG: OsmC family protein [Bacteroidia bacterium]
MQNTTISRHINALAFDAEIDGHTIRFDDKEGNTGPRPKAILLNSLAICAGFDVVPILNKMKVEFSDFSIKTTGDLTDDTPKVYKHIHMEFILKTAKENQTKVARAVELSVEKYCGVYAMLIKVCSISQSISYL